MSALYLESSAVLAWLLGEPAAAAIKSAVDRAKTVCTSELTLAECRRSLVRLTAQRQLKAAQRQQIVGLLERSAADWTLLQITPQILARCGETFPVEPVRTLDAIHLTTALEFVLAYPKLAVLTCDRRVTANAEPLGLPLIPL